MQTVDLILEGHRIIPVEPANTIYQDHAIVIDKGVIIDLLPIDEIHHQYHAKEHQHYPDHVLMPGFINAHTHAAMNLLRGLADDLPLMAWLEKHIWPAEATHVNEEFVADGTRLAIAEMIRSGTTCFNDMYFYADVTAKVAQQAGIRAVVGLIVLDFPTVWASNADDYINKGLAINDQLKDYQLITTAFAPHAPYTVADEALRHIQVLSNELDLGIHMHIHETVDEISQSLKLHQLRPLQRLDKLGMLTPNLQAVHMTQLLPEEIEMIAANGVHVIHCPESNMKLASGMTPVAALLQAGANVALGTDSAASNNDLDMLSEIRSAALLAKAVAHDASVVNTMQAITMATLNGARALGLDELTGSLIAGKYADIIAIDMNNIETQPLYHADSHVVYSSSRDHVSDVWVAGRQLLKNRELTGLNQKEILAKTTQWQQRIHTS